VDGAVELLQVLRRTRELGDPVQRGLNLFGPMPLGLDLLQPKPDVAELGGDVELGAQNSSFLKTPALPQRATYPQLTTSVSCAARDSSSRGLSHHGRGMNKPRIFLGSSGKQVKLLQAIERGLEDLADVEPWTTTFNPGRSTLDRLVELSQEVDFAAFVFAQDDWTTIETSEPGQASPRDNVVFEAGLFGGALGIRRTFILHAEGSKLPSDLLGLTSIRYDPATSQADIRAINQKLRNAIESEGRRGPVEGLWWQLSLTMRSEDEPSAVSLLEISRDRDGGLKVSGRAWQEDGMLSARYWSEAAKERRDPAGIFYFWRGERPRHTNAPQLEGTGEIKVEDVDRASGYWTTRSDRDPGLNARTAGIYLRADSSDLRVLDSGSEKERAQLIKKRLREWKSAANAF